MECYCDDGDPPIFYHKSDVERARAPHECYECHRAILPGESCEHIYALWDRRDGPQNVYTCAWCLELKEWITATVPCFCFLHGGLLDMLPDTIDEYAHETTGLRFGYLRRRKIIESRPTLRELFSA